MREPPPRPRLFKAIAILGIFIGSFGAVSALSALSRGRSVPTQPFGIEFRNDQQARVARQLQQAADRVQDRHSRAGSGLAIADGMLSTLLFVASLALSRRRPWARGLLVQAAIACALYEIPAVVHKVRLNIETIRAQERLMPAYVEAFAGSSSPEDVTLTTGAILMIGLSYTVGVALLRLVYYGIAIHYLRRRDVRSWFEEPETL